jgi:hypothetical protein
MPYLLRQTCLGFGLALLSLSAGAARGEQPADSVKPKLETLQGQVVPHDKQVTVPAAQLKQLGLELDPDAGSRWLALQTDDGKQYPLLQDAGSRMYYRDKTLLNRPMQIQGRLVPGTALLQVLQAHSLKEGKPHEIYYWCEICSIKRFSLEKTGVCECCGGPMELREVLLRK